MNETQDIAFIRDAFDGKKDATERLSIDHAIDTAQTLLLVLKQERESSLVVNLQDLWRAALAHDVLEDTKIDQKILQKKWGTAVLTKIEHLTNRQGDSDFSQYLEHLKTVEEESALIKLADITSNVKNSVICINDKNASWMKTFWIPLLESYLHIFRERPFSSFPRTSRKFLAIIQSQTEILKEKLLHSS